MLNQNMSSSFSIELRYSLSAPRYDCILKIDFLISLPKYVVGTQKNRLNETALLRSQFKLMDKKILTITRSKILFMIYA